MARSDRYILSQLVMLFGFFALVLVSVYWVNRAVQLFDQLISDGQSAWVFLEFTALSLPYVIWLVLPVATFAATLYVINRMMAESELVVMLATGFSPLRLARPVLVYGLVVTVMMSALGHFLIPASRERLAERSDEISANVTGRLLREGTFLHPSKGVTIYIRNISRAGELQDLFLSDGRDPLAPVIYTARRALLVKGEAGPKLIMFDGMAQNLRQPGNRLATTRFADFAYDIGALIARSAARKQGLAELSTPGIVAAGDDGLAALGISRHAAANEVQNRVVQPLLAPVAALLGFAALMTGGFSRFGAWRQIGLAVALLIFVKMIDNAAAGAAQKGGPIILNYLGVAVGVALTAVLLWLAGRPRRIRQAPAPAPALPGGAP